MSDADRPADDQEPTRLSDSELTEAGARQGEAPALRRLGDFELIREIGQHLQLSTADVEAIMAIFTKGKNCS